MGHWLVRERAQQTDGVLTRFDPRFWTVDFPRPMMAAVVNTAPDALRVDCTFCRADDLAGLIWEAEDRFDHPLLAYETSCDFRACVLSFRWRSHGLIPLDAVNGPTLTIEGRDASGAAKTWYVRLWNYAAGTSEDARVSIDFASVRGGFVAGGEPVWAGDVDRMFVSLVPPGYDPGGGDFDMTVEAWAELSDIACDGAGAVLAVGDAMLPEHDLAICTAYDDSYNQTPARLLRGVLRLGYRGQIVHYVGMSHYPRLERNGAGWFASLAGGALNTACAAWYRAFAAEAQALGIGVVWSLSYELLDQHSWGDWKQRSADGAPAATGYTPPSTLLSPCHAGAMGYLQAVARAFVAIGSAAGLAPKFQVGEPWWWVQVDGRPCLYDASAVADFAPAAVPTVRSTSLSATQKATLDAAGARLAASTAALVAALRSDRPDLESYLLTYLPTVLDPVSPEARRMNMPVGWAAPAFDVLQLEDYDYAAAGDAASTANGVAAATARLGYPEEAQEYFSGFVTTTERRADWHNIMAAADAARRRGVRRTYLWALPQVTRDGLTYWRGEDEVQAYDDVAFPLALGREVEVAPEFTTQVTTSAGGRETRSAGWACARTRYDAGPGVRSEADVTALLAFFRARLGPARAFRLRDPFDHDAVAVAIGEGDGATRTFALVKRYGAAERRVTRPVAGSVSVAVDGVATSAWSLGAGGTVTLDVAPAAGAIVSASFEFDVPVRFAEDRLTVSRATYLAGEAASVPLVEVREA